MPDDAILKGTKLSANPTGKGYLIQRRTFSYREIRKDDGLYWYIKYEDPATEICVQMPEKRIGCKNESDLFEIYCSEENDLEGLFLLHEKIRSHLSMRLSRAEPAAKEFDAKFMEGPKIVDY